jgi:predicted  nucleic acid-binding Zn-ribbon protein
MRIEETHDVSQEQFASDKPTPLGNIRILESQLVRIKTQKKDLEAKIKEYESREINLKNVEELEKLEEEWEFLNGYHNTLENQLVVIMNEHDVVIPPNNLLT